MLRYSLILLSCFALLSCNSDQTIDLKDYYYPVDLIGESARYVYKPVRDTLFEPVVWQYSVSKRDNKVVLKGENLDLQGRPTQVHEEEIVRSGSLLRALTLINYDSTGVASEINASIEGNNLFPFEVVDSTFIYFYKVVWDQKTDSLQVSLTRNRRYLGKTQYTIDGQTYDCVRFLLREMLTTDREGMTKSQWVGTELYAKNLGLVYYRKEISPNYILEYQLDENPFETN
jgi:hypothetical protein